MSMATNQAGVMQVGVGCAIECFNEANNLPNRIANLEHEGALLEASTKTKKDQVAAYKQKLYATVKEQATTSKKTAEMRMKFGLQLKLLRHPRQKNMSPLFDEHKKVMLAFHEARCKESTEAQNKFKALGDSIKVPKRFLNAQSYMQGLENSKLDHLKTHSVYREDIQKLGKEQAILDSKLKVAQTDFKVVSLDTRVKVLVGLEEQCDELRKHYVGEYLKAKDNKDHFRV